MKGIIEISRMTEDLLNWSVKMAVIGYNAAYHLKLFQLLGIIIKFFSKSPYIRPWVEASVMLVVLHVVLISSTLV